MLYNQNWSPRPYAFTLDNLIAWLSTKNPDEPYSFYDPNTCLIGQWVRSVDANAYCPNRGDQTIFDSKANTMEYLIHGKAVDLMDFWRIAMGTGHLHWSRTMGDALLRAISARDSAELKTSLQDQLEVVY